MKQKLDFLAQKTEQFAEFFALLFASRFRHSFFISQFFLYSIRSSLHSLRDNFHREKKNKFT